jgi:lipopolysaccharide transport system permease protein
MTRENLVIIRPSQSDFLIDVAELWRYRELLYIFAWRDIKIRYKQTVLGVIWVVLQPLVQMAIFTYFFGKLAQRQDDKLPYFLFVLIGLVFWNYFASTLTQASNSMIENENIIKKVHFPKIILPLSSALTGLADFSINFVVLLVTVLLWGFTPNFLFFLFLPIMIVMSSLSAGGIGLLLAAFNVKYRDVRYILPFFIQLMLFLTPVIYPLSTLSPVGQTLISLNPLTGIIDTARQLLSGSSSINVWSLALGIISMSITFILGLWYFNRTERYFADVV